MAEEQNDMGVDFFVASNILQEPVGSWGNEEDIAMEFFVSYIFEPVGTEGQGDFEVLFVLPATPPVSGEHAAISDSGSEGIIVWGEGSFVKRYVLRRTRAAVTEYLYADGSWNTVDDVNLLMSFMPGETVVADMGEDGVITMRMLRYDDYLSNDTYEVAAEAVDPFDPGAGSTPESRGRSVWVLCVPDELFAGVVGKLIIQGRLIR